MEKELPESMWGMGRMDIKAMQRIIKDGKLGIRYYLGNAHERLNAHVSAIQALNSRVSALTERIDRLEGAEDRKPALAESSSLDDRDVPRPMGVPDAMCFPEQCPDPELEASVECKVRSKHGICQYEKPSIEAWLRVKVLEPGDYRALVGIESGGKVPYYARARIEDLSTDVVSRVLHEELHAAYMKERKGLEGTITRLRAQNKQINEEIQWERDAKKTAQMEIVRLRESHIKLTKEIAHISTVAGAIETLKGHGAAIYPDIPGIGQLVFIPAKKEGE